MNDESSNPNLEWKKTGFDKNERLTLKTNVKKAVEYDSKKKSPIQNSFGTMSSDLPNGLKKIRKKIRDVFDEDDEDENESIIIPNSLESTSSLMNVLNSEEKKILQQKETIENINMLQKAGQGEALTMANRVAQEIGLKGLNKEIVNNNMMNISIGSNPLEKALKEELAKDMKIKVKNMSQKDFVKVLRGIKTIQMVGGKKAVEGMKLQDLVKAGEKKGDKKELGFTSKEQEDANMILEKSGRKEKGKKGQDKKSKNNTNTKKLDNLLTKTRV